MKVAIMINTSWNIYNFRRGLIKAILDRGDGGSCYSAIR